MATPLKVRSIRATSHSSLEYVLLLMYFLGTHRSDKKRGLATFTREVHLVDNLQAKMLIGVDILGPEKIDLLVSKGLAYIESCNVDVEITARPRGSPVRSPVLTNTNTTIPALSCVAVPVKHQLGLVNSSPDARDLLFEPDSSRVSVFAHLADASLSSVLVHNDSKLPITLPQGHRLGFLEDIDLSCQVFHIKDANPGLAELALKSPPPTDSRPPKISSHGRTVTHSSGASIFDDQEGSVDAIAMVLNEFPTIWTDIGPVDIPEDRWMKIPLRSDWESRIKGKTRVHPLGLKDHKIVEETFAELESQGRIFRTTKLTSFGYPVFIVWKPVYGVLKGRMVVDIRGLNQLVTPDVYPMPSQAEILASIRGCRYISAIDATAYFNQWRVHPESRHCLTVVSHLGQHTFNCTITGFRNTPAYMQREMDRILVDLPFARAYMDDIVLAGRTLEEHII